GRAEPAAVARVEEQRGLNFSQLDCPIEPGRIAGGLEQLNQSPRETRIVFAESVNCRLAITIPANETTLARVPEMRAGEFRGANRGRTPFGSPRAVDHLAGRPRHRGDHQAVPRRKNLVVEMRPRTCRARVEQHLPGPSQHPHDALDIAAGPDGDVFDRLRDVKQVEAAELTLRIRERVAAILDAEPAAHDRRIIAQQLVNFGTGEDVEGALTGR